MVYEMTVDLNVLDHLGINLYSNIAAVLTETVANAWDADATLVDITIDDAAKFIEIMDDGIGMNVASMNDKYLRVGYRRRAEDPNFGKVTASGRPAMGRKGLGKLSLFSIAETIRVESSDGKDAPHGLIMSVAGIKESVEKRQANYAPDPVDPKEISITKGTRIYLTDLKRERLGRSTVALRKRLARRFSVLGKAHNFTVKINGREILPNERGDLDVLQFMWQFDDKDYKPLCPRLVEHEQLENRLEEWESDWRIDGWIGTSKVPGDLDDEDAGNLNGIVVFARGRLFQENILDSLNDGHLYTKYLTGQIEADFLDADDRPDIATSDRQRVLEDDVRYRHLLTFLRARLSRVEATWTVWRQKHELDKVKKDNPAVADWVESLPSGFKKSASKMLSKISAIPMDSDDNRKLMLKHGIIAFERMRLRGSTDEFAEHFQDVNSLLSLLADRDSLEASFYRDIVASRLDAITAFDGLVSTDDKEKALQQYLFNHLWLLDPAWERATDSPIMESRLMREGVIVDDLTEKEALGRVDIAYRTVGGKHVIVELKRAGRNMTLNELSAQGQTYVDKLKKVLIAAGDPSDNIEVVFILGKPVEEEKTNVARLKFMMDAISPGSRITHYDTLIRGAQEAYADYMKRSAESDRIGQIVDRIV